MNEVSHGSLSWLAQQIEKQLSTLAMFGYREQLSKIATSAMSTGPTFEQI